MCHHLNSRTSRRFIYIPRLVGIARSICGDARARKGFLLGPNKSRARIHCLAVFGATGHNIIARGLELRRERKKPIYNTKPRHAAPLYTHVVCVVYCVPPEWSTVFYGGERGMDVVHFVRPPVAHARTHARTTYMRHTRLAYRHESSSVYVILCCGALIKIISITARPTICIYMVSKRT